MVNKTSSASDSRVAIRQYYEQNTGRFLSFGRQRRTRTIHRAVWAEGVSRTDEALNHTNLLIHQQLAELAQANPSWAIRTADLGCGVGGSLFYLARCMPVPFWGVGLTISPQQAQMAQQHAAQLGLQERCAFIEADFQHPPLVSDLESAFSIEAFAHSPDQAEYLRAAARLLRSGGRLILCDDFLTDYGDEDNDWLRAFRSGWQVSGLSTTERVSETAVSLGLDLRLDTDLTPYLRLSAIPELLAIAIVGSGKVIKHPYWQSISGGIALQQCLKQGLVSYRFLVFEKD